MSPLVRALLSSGSLSWALVGCATDAEPGTGFRRDAGAQPGAPASSARESGQRIVATCPVGTWQAPPAMSPLYDVALRVHLTRSSMSQDEVCDTLDEINSIWWTQGGICFSVEVVNHDVPAASGFDLWFEARAPFPNGVDANGVYSGDHQIYSLDHPSLEQAPHPVTHLAARTAAHELGHALALWHQDCGTDCNDLLMRSGFQGFALVSGTPANADEPTRARSRAAFVGRELRAVTDVGERCLSPIFLE